MAGLVDPRWYTPALSAVRTGSTLRYPFDGRLPFEADPHRMLPSQKKPTGASAPKLTWVPLLLWRTLLAITQLLGGYVRSSPPMARLPELTIVLKVSRTRS